MREGIRVTAQSFTGRRSSPRLSLGSFAKIARCPRQGAKSSLRSTVAQAVEWLRKSRSLKYLSTPSTRFLLADDRELDSLRARDDFRALLAQPNKVPAAGK